MQAFCKAEKHSRLTTQHCYWTTASVLAAWWSKKQPSDCLVMIVDPASARDLWRVDLMHLLSRKADHRKLCLVIRAGYQMLQTRSRIESGWHKKLLGLLQRAWLVLRDWQPGHWSPCNQMSISVTKCFWIEPPFQRRFVISPVGSAKNRSNVKVPQSCLEF